MINKLASLSTAALLASTLTANAASLEVYYEGKVNSISGDGGGYTVNDIVTGSLFINTDLMPVDFYSSSMRGYYHNNGSGNSDFVTSYNDSGTYSHDYIYVEDAYNDNRDYYYVRDSESNSYDDGQGNYGYSEESIYVYAYDYILNFISGDGIEQLFDLSAGDADMFGQISSSGFSYEDNVQTDNHSGHAYLTLSRLSVGSVSAVPEPGTLALLTLGLAGIGFRKRCIA